MEEGWGGLPFITHEQLAGEGEGVLGGQAARLVVELVEIERGGIEAVR